MFGFVTVNGSLIFGNQICRSEAQSEAATEWFRCSGQFRKVSWVGNMRWVEYGYLRKVRFRKVRKLNDNVKVNDMLLRIVGVLDDSVLDLVSNINQHFVWGNVRELQHVVKALLIMASATA